MNTRKIVMFLHTGYCGMDAHEFWEVSSTATDEELGQLCWERAKDHAEMYGIYPYEEYSEEPDFDEYDESYSHNIEGSFTDYNPDKHDRHRVGGDTSWQEY
jgi:hypothetical protein